MERTSQMEKEETDGQIQKGAKMMSHEFKVKVENVSQSSGYPNQFIVARLVDGELWYYGVYETEERANEVRSEFENGIVLKGVSE